MESSTSIVAARRNLAQRIERFLAVKRETIMTAGEATNITAALACLESGRYADGEDAMMLGDHRAQARFHLRPLHRSVVRSQGSSTASGE
jgi:hypothetical protein